MTATTGMQDVLHNVTPAERRPLRHHDGVTDIDVVLQALAERGTWHGGEEGDAELLRIEVRRAARRAKIKVRTLVDSRGRLHAYTPDGWPAREPWRGAAIHAQGSGAMDAVVAQALDRLLRREDHG
jgi:hypothetical protein